MDQIGLSRRNFLKLGALALGCLAANRLPMPVPPEDREQPVGIARITTALVYIYDSPSFNAQRIGRLTRDRLVTLLEEFNSPAGPSRNPRWYRVRAGYVHSAYMQRVDDYHTNPVQEDIPEAGALGTITLPYVRTYRYIRGEGWKPLYRLYYQSNHHVVGVDQGPDGKAWYRLTDDLIYVHYHVPAEAVALLPGDSLAPLASHVPRDEKQVIISISQQTLTAYEGGQPVFFSKISSGIPHASKNPDDLPTDTPTGSFRIRSKLPARHMGDGNLTNDIYAYELPGVPWTMLFHKDGYALHGTYWHDNFGMRMSHGCVNMPNQAALWLFRWSEPVCEPGVWFAPGEGTRLTINP